MSNKKGVIIMYNEKMLEKNISQEPAIKLFEKLGYTYISPEECVQQRKGLYGCVLQDILKEQLKKINSYDYNGKTNKFSNFLLIIVSSHIRAHLFLKSLKFIIIFLDKFLLIYVLICVLMIIFTYG